MTAQTVEPRGVGDGFLPEEMAARLVLVRSAMVLNGAAGFAAAEMLRREGFAGSLTMLSSDDAPPCDRPNLSKDYLAGNAPEDWIPLRPPEFYGDAGIDLQLRTEVAAIDPKSREVTLTGGRSIGRGPRRGC